jgi:hypothetical protein
MHRPDERQPPGPPALPCARLVPAPGNTPHETCCTGGTPPTTHCTGGAPTRCTGGAPTHCTGGPHPTPPHPSPPLSTPPHPTPPHPTRPPAPSRWRWPPAAHGELPHCAPLTSHGSHSAQGCGKPEGSRGAVQGSLQARWAVPHVPPFKFQPTELLAMGLTPLPPFLHSLAGPAPAGAPCDAARPGVPRPTPPYPRHTPPYAAPYLRHLNSDHF